MADPVSAIAGATTLAGTAFQTIQVAVKTKRDFKRLPDRIIEIRQRIQDLEGFLRQAKQHNDSFGRLSGSQNNALLADCIHQGYGTVESASQFMDNACERTSGSRKFRRMISSAMILFNQNLNDTEARLHRTEELLTRRYILAYMNADIELKEQTLSRNRVNEHTPSLPLTQTVPGTGQVQTQSSLSEKPNIKNIPILFDSGGLEQYQRTGHSSLITSCPKRLSSRGRKFESRGHASEQVPISPRTCIIQPDNSEIFFVVAEGNLTKMLHLFASGEASLFVRDNEGSSLLHYASCSNNLLICKRLLELGLRDYVDEETSHGFTPGHLSLLNSIWNMDHGKKPLDELIAMLEKFSSYPEYGESPRVLLLGCCTGTTDVATLSRFQRKVAPRFFQQSTDNLLCTARLYVQASQSCRHPDADVLLLLLGQQQADQLGGVAYSSCARVHLLHTAAIGLIRYRRDYRPTFSGQLTAHEYNRGMSRWNNICRTLIRDSTDDELHCVEHIWLDQTLEGYSRTPPSEWTGSPMMSVIQALFLDDFQAQRSASDVDFIGHRSWHQSMSSTINVWLQQVVESGVDLIQYGQREKQIMTSQRLDDPECLDFTARRSFWSSERHRFVEDTLSVRLLDFEYGAVVQDWVFHWQTDFCWQTDVEKPVGEFCLTVNSEIDSPQLPGALVE